MTTLQTIHKLLAPLKHFRRLTTRAIIFAIISGILSSLTPIISSQAIKAMETADTHLFWISFWLLLGSTLISIIKTHPDRVTSNHLYNDLYQYLTEHYITRYSKLDLSYGDYLGTGKIKSIISQGVNTWSDLGAYAMMFLIRETTTIVSSIIILSLTSHRSITVSVVILLFLYILISSYSTQKLQKFKQQRRDIALERDTIEMRLITARHELLKPSFLGYNFSQLLGATIHLKQLFIQDSLSRLTGDDILVYLVDIVKLPLFLIGGLMVFDGGWSISSFLMAYFFVGVIERSFNSIRKEINSLAINFVSIEKLRHTIDDGPTMHHIDTGMIYQHQQGMIEVSQLSFGYSTDNKIFEGLSLTIPGRSITALVGPSGGGKSTLIKLIGGYITASSGTISIDGQSLPLSDQSKNNADTTLALSSYRSHIGYLAQEPNVFDGSIFDNLFPHLPEGHQTSHAQARHDPHIIELMKQALLHAQCQFVLDHDQGLNLKIGDKGIKLSGGQRQRLAIAKLHLRQPQIILMDEPTSALDSENEQLIQQSLNELFKNRTVIIIAHRLQTVKHADRILYIENGMIAEQGTHEELIALDGKYANMLNIQTSFS